MQLPTPGPLYEQRSESAMRDTLMRADAQNFKRLTAPPEITGSRGGNAALAVLLTALAAMGLIVDSTTA